MAHAREVMRKLRKENPDFAERQRELSRRWKATHPRHPSREKQQEYRRRYEAKHKEKLLERRRKYYRDHRVHLVEKSREWARANPEKKKFNMFMAGLRRHNVTLDQYHAMLEQQGELCAICRSVLQPMHKETHIDHDHATGKVRGLLCGACNLGLGKFKDNPAALRAAAAYVEAEHA